MAGVTIADEELTAISGWTDEVIAQDGARAAGVLYAAAALEELALIELVERLNELNQNKLLSIGAGRASNLLHEFWDQGYKRMTARRRAALFARVFGSVAGDDRDAAGSDGAFPGLLRRLVSSLADGPPEAVTQAAVELRDDLAAHTDDATSAAAVELRATLGAIAEVLSDMELRSAFGAGDMWQLVERLQEEHGGGCDVRRARGLATRGALILRRLPELCADPAVDRELAEAAEGWLAADARAA
jgi:hypothetical protein